MKTMKVKCNNCGSSNIELQIGTTDGKTYDIKPKSNISKKKIKKILKNYEDGFWICYGDCSDETSAIMTVANKKIDDPYYALEYLLGEDKKVNIEKAVLTDDVDSVKDFLKDNMDKIDDYGLLLRSKGWTLLITALNEQKYEVAKLLINSGCDVNKPIEYPMSRATPFMILVGNKYKSEKQFEIADLLLDNGADPYITNVGGDDTFTWADRWSSKKALKKYILEKSNKH